LIEYPVRLALPKSHPHADKPEIPLSLLKEEPFIGLNRLYPNYGDWFLKFCRRAGFKPQIVKEADGAAWKPDALTAPVASQFIDVLTQTCASGYAEAYRNGKRISTAHVESTINQ
jgi:hypothetical protein